MTKDEFLKLDYGNIVTCKRYPGEVYEIDDTDVFGVGDRDPIFRVFGARDRANNKDIRIDMQNYAVWDVFRKEALLVIDVQNDYFPGGTNELHNPYEAEARINELITESRKCGRPIIYIQHINPPDDYFFLEGTHGVEISDRIKPCTGDKVIVKHFPNSFLETELNDYLKSLDVDTLIVCGMMTHMCVDTTVRAAMDYGYQVKLVANACATMDLEIAGEIIPADTVQKTFIASLEGVFATVI